METWLIILWFLVVYFATKTLLEPFGSPSSLQITNILRVSNGVQLLITGGQAPYLISIVNQNGTIVSTHPRAEYLEPGNYRVRVTDQNNEYVEKRFVY